MGSPPFLQALLPSAAQGSFLPRPSTSVSQASGPRRGHADLEEVKGAGARPSSNKRVAVRGGPLLFFPGLRRGACQEDVEAGRPPAAPRRVADRRQQLCGRRGARALPSQHRGPPVPLLTSQRPPTPATTQGPPFQGQRARLWASLGWGPWPDAEARTGIRLQHAGQAPGKAFLPPSPLWIPSRALTACSPSRDLPRLFL